MPKLESHRAVLAPPCAAPAQRQCSWLSLVRAIAGACLALVVNDHPGAAAGGVLHLRCTNPASGASWHLAIDLDHNRVGSAPATITEGWISWHDPKQGFFDLERATGKLRLRNASSTGGYFLYYACRSD